MARATMLVQVPLGKWNLLGRWLANMFWIEWGWVSMIAKQRTGLRFRLSTAMAVTLFIALALGLWRASPMVFWFAVAGAVVANVLGYAVGWFFTFVLRLPNDGSLNWDPDDADSEQGDAASP